MRRAHCILLHTVAIGAMAVGTAGNARAAAISYSTAFCFDVSTTPCAPSATTATTSRSSGGSTATVTGGLFDVDIPSGTFVKLGTIDSDLVGSAFSTNFVLRMLLTQHVAPPPPPPPPSVPEPGAIALVGIGLVFCARRFR